MKVIRFDQSSRKEYWLSQIARSDWKAGIHLHEMLKKGTFHEMCGETSDVFLLTEADRLISFCTFAERDEIQPTELTPWIGFVYTFPEYRGYRNMGKLLDEIFSIASEENIPAVYLSTDTAGLYEKYGFEFLAEMKNMHGEISRIYIRRIPDRDPV